MNEKLYEKRLQHAIDWAHRNTEGQFLLQHVLRLTGLHNIGSDENSALFLQGQRSVGVQFLNDVGRNRIAKAITMTIYARLLEQDFEEDLSDDDENADLDAYTAEHVQ